MNNKKLLLGIVIGIIVLIIVVILFILLSRKTLTCTFKSDQSSNGYSISANYVVKAKYGIVQRVKINEVITSKDSKVLNKFEKQFNKQYSYNKKTYGGYKYKITNNNDKVTSNVTIDYNKLDMKQFIDNNAAMKEYTENNKLTLDGAKKMYEATGAVCK